MTVISAGFPYNSGIMIANFLLILSLFTPSSTSPQGTSLKGSLEGVVLQNGTLLPPIGGARITVTRVNPATGQGVSISGYPSSSTFSDGGGVPFPGRGPAPTAPPVPTPPPPPPAIPIPSVLTDRDGRFLVPDLEEGWYRILVTQDGFVKQEYGQRVFPGQGTALSLAAGQKLKDLVVRLIATGNIGGRLVDNEGRAAVGVPLQLLKASYNAGGQRLFQLAGSARTNDRGEYRFYWITPARYYLAAGHSTANVGFLDGNNSPNEPGHSYTYTYYPGVTAMNRAVSLEVKPGSESTVDFVVPKQQLYTVSGRIVDPTGTVTANLTAYPVTVSLAFLALTGRSGVWTINRAFDPATGVFVLRDVLPGSYVLQVAAPPATARVPLEVTNANIEGLVVAMDSGINISGRFVVEGGEFPTLNTVRVQMRPVTSETTNVVGYIPTGQAVADGTFAIPNVLPGQYRLAVPSSQDFYVKELRFERRDALNDTVEVSRRGSDSATMEIVISRNVAQLEGTVMDDRMQPVPGVQAVLIPDRNRDRPGLYRTATTDQTGRFVIRGIAPGDYKVFAWEAMENFGYFDPDVMMRAESLGTPVQVAESSRLAVNTKVIPAAP